MRKRAGCCSLCDVEVFEVGDRKPNGDPKQILAPLENARRLTLVLWSGHTANLTLCGECQLTPDRMSEIHATMVEALHRGTQHRTIPLEPAAAETERRMLYMATQDIPMGVLEDRLWTEVR